MFRAALSSSALLLAGYAFAYGIAGTLLEMLP